MARIRRTEDAPQVYSTDGGRVRTERTSPARRRRDRPAVQGGPPADGVVRVSRTSAGRGGKTVTLITGIPRADLDTVASELKRRCGAGGTVKDGVIEIQGDRRDAIVEQLASAYRVKPAGG